MFVVQAFSLRNPPTAENPSLSSKKSPQAALLTWKSRLVWIALVVFSMCLPLRRNQYQFIQVHIVALKSVALLALTLANPSRRRVWKLRRLFSPESAALLRNRGRCPAA